MRFLVRPQISPCTTQVALNWGLIRFIELPRGITYCYSRAKTLDIVENILPALECHSFVHTVSVHVGTNDTKLRQSIKLQEDLELVAVKIESLGKHCVFSGPTPTLRKGCELFRRLYGVDQWQQNLCIATDQSFIRHFDSFWLDLMSSGEITYTLIVGGHASLKHCSLPTLEVYQLTD